MKTKAEIVAAIAAAKSVADGVKIVQENRDAFTAEQERKANLIKMYGADALDDAPVEPSTDNYFHTGAVTNPLRIDSSVLNGARTAALEGKNFTSKVTTKTFSTTDSLIPASFDPNVLPAVHEGRLLDFLPTQAISTPTYRILVHSSTSGAPAVTSEGGSKPDVVMTVTNIDLTAVKLAASWGISHETLSDHAQFMAYSQSEMVRQVADVETAQLLSGLGTGGAMTGFLHTSGILSHDASTDTGTLETSIDSIEKSIKTMRVGAALAVADTLVLNPATWSAIRRLKDTTGRMLFIPSTSDVSSAEANSIFGLRVVSTTAIAAGTGLLLDTKTRPFGRVFIREGLTIKSGTSTDDFVRNISRFVIEERLVLGVERPASVLAISNLPTS